MVMVSLVIMGFLFVACEKERVETNVNKELVSAEDVFAHLKLYNNNLVVNNCNSNRGFFSSLGNICMIAGADIIGAGTGIWACKEILAYYSVATGGAGGLIAGAAVGLVCGAGASYAVTRNVIDMPNLNEVDWREIPFFLDKRYDVFNQIGYGHNTYLKQVKYGRITEVDWIKENYREYSDDLIMLFSTNEIVNLRSTIISLSNKYKEDNYDYSLFLQSLHDERLLSTNIHKTLALFMEGYVMSESYDDIANICDFYTKQILDSNFSELEKQALVTSFSVATKSPLFWNKLN